MVDQNETPELTPAEAEKEFNKIEQELAEKYGFTVEQVKQMAEIYPSLSLQDFFKEGHKECVLEIIKDRGKQPIPVDKCKFDIPEDQIETIVDEKTGEDMKVVYTPVLVVRLLNTDDRGKIFSRIPSGSESTGLLKIEYARKHSGMTLEGTMIKITEITFPDKTGTDRDGYAVDEVLVPVKGATADDEPEQIESKE